MNSPLFLDHKPGVPGGESADPDQVPARSRVCQRRDSHCHCLVGRPREGEGGPILRHAQGQIIQLWS